METTRDVPYEDFKVGQNIRLLFFKKVKSVCNVEGVLHVSSIEI